MFVCLVFNDTFSTYRLYRAIGIWNIYCVGPGETHSNINKPKKITHIHALPPGLCGVYLLTSWRCHQRGLSIANHLASTDNWTKTKHTWTHRRIQSHIKNTTKRRCTMNRRKKILGQINRTDRSSHSMDLVIPMRSPNRASSLHTYKQCTARGSSWGSSIPVWPLKAPGSAFGERVTKPFVSSMTPVSPEIMM